MATSPDRRLRLAALCMLLAPILPAAAGAGPVEPDPHGRMVRELARLAATAAQQVGPYRTHDRLLGLKASIPSRVPPARKADMLGQLAVAALRAGRFAAARETFAEIVGLAEQIPGASRQSVGGLAEYFTGVAWIQEAIARECAGTNRSACVLGARAELSTQSVADLERAVAHLLRSRVAHGAASPGGIASAWLAGLAVDLGAPVVDAGLPSPAAAMPRPLFPRFHDVAADLGLDSFDYAGGMVVDDFDGDGMLDVFSTTTDIAGQVRLFRNVGDGTFEDRTEAAGLMGITGGLNAVQADYDGDGDLDLLILRGAWRAENGRWPNSLLRNEGEMRFRDVTYEVGLGAPAYPTQVGVWADYDNDGDLDLYVANESTDSFAAPSQLFRNDAGRFVDVASEAGVSNLRWSKSAAWGDFDGDGWVDLYVSNLHGPNRLYRNRRDGTFQDVAIELGVDGPSSSFAAWFWDTNEDGHLDLVVHGYQMREAGGAGDIWHAAADRLGLAHEAEPSRLYLGDGRGGFVEVGEEWGIAHSNLPMAANFGDLDNDGWLDFYLGTGYPGFEGLYPNVMYRNVDGERFVDVSAPGGFAHLAKGHGIAFADLDHDGDQDVLEQLGGFLPGDEAFNIVLENPGTRGNWVSVELRGMTSNSHGLGAVLIAELPGSPPRRLHRVVGSGASFGANPLRVHLGLGEADRVRRLTIRWPGGHEQRIGRLEAGAHYRITEGESRPRQIDRPPFRLGGS